MVLKTELRGRTLWYDGTEESEPEKVADLLLLGHDIKKIAVTEMTDEIKQFNFCSGQNLSVKTECELFHTEFLIPDSYKQINLHEYFLAKQALRNDSEFEIERRTVRIENELLAFAEFEYLEMLKVIIYMFDTFKEQKIVWGVGRGSSCASYLLFLIGVHLVDPIKYGIHYSEFLHS